MEHGLDIFSDDVVAAFISSSLGEDEVYLQVPEGFDCPEGYVLKLRCAVEGLKQCSAKWTTKVDRILDHQGFKAVDAEACLYYKVTDGLLCLVARYVDDTLSGVHPSQKWVYDALIEAIMADGLELHRLGNAVGQKFLSIQTTGSLGPAYWCLIRRTMSGPWLPSILRSPFIGQWTHPWPLTSTLMPSPRHWKTSLSTNP